MRLHEDPILREHFSAEFLKQHEKTLMTELHVDTARRERASDEIADDSKELAATEGEALLTLLGTLDRRICSVVSPEHAKNPKMAMEVGEAFSALTKVQRQRGTVNPSKSDFTESDASVFGADSWAMKYLSPEIRARMRSLT